MDKERKTTSRKFSFETPALRPYELIGADVQCLKSSGVKHFVT